MLSFQIISLSMVLLVGVIGLVVLPVWILSSQADQYLKFNRDLAVRRHRFDTYTCIEQAIRETRRDLPVSQRLVLAGKTIPRARARRIYAAQPGSKFWAEKAMITELLERLDRLAVGVRIGTLEPEVWQKIAGYNIVSLCRILQNFVLVSREGREDRYASLSQVDELFQKMMISDEQAIPQSAQSAPSSG